LTVRNESASVSRRRAASALLAVVVALAAVACARSGGKRYPLTGVVQDVLSSGELVVAHDDIPGLMPAMVMPFHIRGSKDAIQPGDRIEATLVMTDKESWLEDVRVTARGLPTSRAASGPQEISTASPGDAVPDFALVNQDGKPIHLRQYAGQTLVFTFIYTRCPVPEFCPLMMRNFQALDEALSADRALSSRTHLLTVSFDTVYDTPDVLSSFGRAHVKDRGEGRFARWELATGSKEQVKAIAGFFGLMFWGDEGLITHSLRTAIIGSDGKVAKVYNDNLWTVEEAVRDIRAVAR
jgi:protein SCO1